VDVGNRRTPALDVSGRVPRRHLGTVTLAGDQYLLIDTGDWDATVIYQAGNLVTRAGVQYVALPVTGNLGQTPPNAAYWQLFRERIGFLGADRTWKPVARTKIVEIDGLGAVVALGVSGDTALDFDCTITGWRIAADQVGSIVVDIWKVPFADFPPTVANTITGGAQPTLASEDHASSTALSGWTMTVTAGDVFRFNVDSVATVTRVLLTLALDAE
jgi:hypothetical protein